MTILAALFILVVRFDGYNIQHKLVFCQKFEIWQQRIMYNNKTNFRILEQFITQILFLLKR